MVASIGFLTVSVSSFALPAPAPPVAEPRVTGASASHDHSEIGMSPVPAALVFDAKSGTVMVAECVAACAESGTASEAVTATIAARRPRRLVMAAGMCMAGSSRGRMR